MSLPVEMIHHLRCLTRLVFVVTDEEDRFITDFREQMKKHADRTWVFNAALGLKKIDDLVRDWTSRAHAVETSAAQINEALIQIYKDDPKDAEHFYLITDPDRWLKDEHVVRRILNVVHQLHNDLRIVKCLIFVGSRRSIPEKLSQYFEVVNSSGLSGEETKQTVESLCKQLDTAVPPNCDNLFRGMTSYSIESAITQSVVRTKKDPVNPKRVDPKFIAEYRRSQIRKTDLVQIFDPGMVKFDSIGGAENFKEWANLNRACWTEEGTKFGLVPPKGVLLVGVYGCGKSLSAKGLASEWNLPLVQFEMGKLRSSGVGDSESNVYRALRIIESVSPCIMWIDEAEKSLSGSQSSAQSDAGTTSRLLGILSTWVQETKAPVCLIMTANSLKNLPPEMVNRLPERFFFDIPDEDARMDIIKIQARQLPVPQDVSQFNLAELSEASKRLVGREIEQAVASAMVRSFNAKKPGLDEELLHDELTRKPRIVNTMGDEIKEITEWVGFDPELNDGVRAHLASKGRSESFRLVSGE